MLLAAGLLVGIGGALIKKTLGAPGEAEAAIWFRSGRMLLLATLAKAVHSIVTVGMGTSLGRESPIKQAGGAIASRLALGARLSRAEQRLLVACGVGAGMASAYNVPVGGALFAVEVLLGSISLRLALPALLCSGVATAASWVFLPTGPIYEVPEYPLTMQLTVWSLVAGPLLGLATVPLIQVIGWAEAHKPHAGWGVYVAPIAVLTILGAVSVPFPELLGNGKDVVQLAYADEFGLSLLLVLPALKLLATAGCLGGGASGGLFTPTMTVGALLGGLLGHAWDAIWSGASMGSCSVIGSCAFLAAATQGPISALVLVLELTRHVDATMVPMLLAVAGAMLVARKIESRSIYSIRFHLGNPRTKRGEPSQWPNFKTLVSRDFPATFASAGFGQVARLLLSSGFKPPLYVLDHEGQLIGTIDKESLENAKLGAMPIEAAKAADIATEVQPLDSQMSEQEVLDRLAQTNVEAQMPGRDPHRRVRGFPGEGGIESRFVAVGLSHPQVEVVEILKGRQDNLRREGQRGDDGPRRDGAVVGTIGHAARDVIEEIPFFALAFSGHPTGAGRFIFWAAPPRWPIFCSRLAPVPRPRSRPSRRGSLARCP
jgi:H+/Cl- antiporter ClcA